MSEIPPSSSHAVRAAGLTLAGQVGGLLLTLVATVMMVRSLGPAEYGSFTTLLAVLGLVMLLPDFGLSPILIRDLAARPSSAGEIVGSGLVVRSVLLLGVVGLFHMLAPLVGITGEKALMMDVLFTGGVFSGRILGLRNVLDGVYRARMTLGIPTAATLIDGLVLVGGVLVVVSYHPTLWAFVFVYALSPMPGFLVSATGLFHTLRGSLRVNWLSVRSLLKDAYPIAAYVGLTTLYANVDVLLLGQWRGLEEVGFYASALRLTSPLQFLPLAVVLALFPLQAQVVDENGDKVRPPFMIGFKIVLSLGFAFAMGGLFTGSGILDAVYGETFSVAGRTLSLLLGSTVFGFANLYVVSFNNATRRQSVNTLVFGAALVVNMALNIILIPGWSHEGAAFARLAAEVLTFLGLLTAIRSRVTLPSWSLALRMVLSGVAALALGWMARPLHPIVNAFVVVLAVLVGLVVFRFFAWKEVLMVAEAIPASMRRNH